MTAAASEPAFYQHPQETWDAKTCLRVSRARPKDGMGATHPFPGYVSSHYSAYCVYGKRVRFNGGCIRDGEWYPGEEHPLPKIPEEFEFFSRPTWGWYIRKKEKAHDVV